MIDPRLELSIHLCVDLKRFNMNKLTSRIKQCVKDAITDTEGRSPGLRLLVQFRPFLSSKLSVFTPTFRRLRLLTIKW